MFRRLYPIILFLFISIFSSCKTQKPLTPSRPGTGSAQDYINQYKELAVREMNRTGVPASITLAQGMIESDYGRSRLAREANNHFGIKCHSNWKGPTVTHHDDKRNECFRKYRQPDESFTDHSDFLKTGSRYAFLFDLKQDDYKGWARGLKKAGYATNPDYANMLIKKIEELGLYTFDIRNGMAPKKATPGPVLPVSDSVIKLPVVNNAGVANGDSPVIMTRAQRIKENNRIQYIIVKPGETKEELEKEFSLLKWELSKYNELESDFNPVPGQMLYLQPKREKAEPGIDYHVVKDGDTMYTVSQLYGIKIKNLNEMNRMNTGAEPVTGTKLWLRNLKPVI